MLVGAFVACVKRPLAALIVWALMAVPSPLLAQTPGSAPVLLDRTVVRFSAPETGGDRMPRFIFERVLAFEARLEALQDPAHASRRGGAYTENHVRAALERHIAEVLLSSLAIDPQPSVATIESQMTLARAMLAAQVGGESQLIAALRSEGLGTQALRRLLRRRALASLYLDRMVAPMLTPTVTELRELHVKSALAEQPFERVRDDLERMYIGRALREAVANFYQNARSRLSVAIL